MAAQTTRLASLSLPLSLSLSLSLSLPNTISPPDSSLSCSPLSAPLLSSLRSAICGLLYMVGPQFFVALPSGSPLRPCLQSFVDLAPPAPIRPEKEERKTREKRLVLVQNLREKQSGGDDVVLVFRFVSG